MEVLAFITAISLLHAAGGSMFLTTKIFRVPMVTEVMDMVNMDGTYTDYFKKITVVKDSSLHACFMADRDPSWSPTLEDRIILIAQTACERYKLEKEIEILREKVGELITKMCQDMAIVWLTEADQVPPPLSARFSGCQDEEVRSALNMKIETDAPNTQQVPAEVSKPFVPDDNSVNQQVTDSPEPSIAVESKPPLKDNAVQQAHVMSEPSMAVEANQPIAIDSEPPTRKTEEFLIPPLISSYDGPQPVDLVNVPPSDNDGGSPPLIQDNGSLNSLVFDFPTPPPLEEFLRQNPNPDMPMLRRNMNERVGTIAPPKPNMATPPLPRFLRLCYNC